MTAVSKFSFQALDETLKRFKDGERPRRIALLVIQEPQFTPDQDRALRQHGVTAILRLGRSEVSPAVPADGLPRVAVDAADLSAFDLGVIYDPRYWDGYQEIGMRPKVRDAVMACDLPIIPYAANAERYPLLPEPYFAGADVMKLRLDDTIYQYISRNNLRGDYAEFGTWFGRSFYRSFLYFKEQLDGNFWAFDSFGGLPKTSPSEAEFTKGDFTEGRYFCNEASFRTIGQMIFPQEQRLRERIKLVKGFYDQTLDGHTIQDYGIAEHSISYCSIDCDLFDATLSVLRFIAPALQNGAVMYLDDYRMARAAKGASLYDAVRVWLGENPGYHLIDLHREHWQHQYVIFNRY